MLYRGVCLFPRRGKDIFSDISLVWSCYSVISVLITKKEMIARWPWCLLIFPGTLLLTIWTSLKELVALSVLRKAFLLLFCEVFVVGFGLISLGNICCSFLLIISFYILRIRNKKKTVIRPKTQGLIGQKKSLACVVSRPKISWLQQYM